jgi:inosine-uridine nucleoside N-ribohydrolase
MSQPKVILDVDPGIDDAVAVIAALKSKSIDIIGISVVSLSTAGRICQKQQLPLEPIFSAV